MRRGKTRIDKNDIIGKSLGKLEVVSYINQYYSHTMGGERLRHLYMCR